MAETVERGDQIPDAPFYVHMRDTFMSGWGKAEGRDAIYVAPCESRYEAEVVAANARARGDQDRVRITTRKPNPNAHGIERLVLLMSRTDSARWYEPDGFGD